MGARSQTFCFFPFHSCGVLWCFGGFGPKIGRGGGGGGTLFPSPGSDTVHQSGGGLVMDIYRPEYPPTATSTRDRVDAEIVHFYANKIQKMHHRNFNAFQDARH